MEGRQSGKANCNIIARERTRKEKYYKMLGLRPHQEVFLWSVNVSPLVLRRKGAETAKFITRSRREDLSADL